MPSARPLFITGAARGGTNLAARMLDAHPAVSVAVDPYFPLFLSLRDAIVRAAGLQAAAGRPLQDYYFTDAGVHELDALLDGDLEVPVDASELAGLRAAVAGRAESDAGEIVPFVGRLGGTTYRELFDSALAAIAAARPEQVAWRGCKEVWVIDLFRPLARAYPEARFVLLHRDPRAVLASMLTLAQRDPSQRAHPLSYLRHWRKAVAVGERFSDDPLFAGRLLVIRYEDLVRDPESSARRLATFLELQEDAAMLGAAGFRDLARGGRWAGNSSYDDAHDGIAADRVARWRDSLDPRAVMLAELVCDPELALLGYESAGGFDEADVLEYLVETNRDPGSWRSDSGDPVRDLEDELDRRRLLDGRARAEPSAVRRAFLFDDVFAQLRDAQTAKVVS